MAGNRYDYGLDVGDGFIGEYLFPNYVVYIKYAQFFKCQSYVNEVV